MSDIIGTQSQQLIELRDLVNKGLIRITNAAQAAGYKFRYKCEWTKGTKKIEDVDGKVHKSYYTLRLMLEDFTHERKEKVKDGKVIQTAVSAKRIPLYVYHVPTAISINTSRLEYEALRGMFFYMLSIGINTQYAFYTQAVEHGQDNEMLNGNEYKEDENR